jgi:uncharacterized protein
MHITVVCSPAARQVVEKTLEIPSGATVLEALTLARACGSGQFELPTGTEAVGIWGKPVPLNHLLIEGDRLEIYRSLLADPKVARRERFLKQGKRGAGLFANRRPGSKPGY